MKTSGYRSLGKASLEIVPKKIQYIPLILITLVSFCCSFKLGLLLLKTDHIEIEPDGFELTFLTTQIDYYNMMIYLKM